LKIFNL